MKYEEDDGTDFFADSTTVDRRAARAVSASPFVQREPYVRIEAAIRSNVSGNWVGQLIRAGGSQKTMKWHHVASFVLDGADEAAKAVRDGLSHQVLVVTDPMEMARDLDLRLASQTGNGPLVGGLLLGIIPLDGSGVIGTFAKDIRGWIARDLLDSSGVGTVETLVRDAASWERTAQRPALTSRTIALHVNGSINLAAKIASRSMMLVLHERDPETYSTSAFRPNSGFSLFGVYDTSAIAQVRLDRIAAAKVVFDRGEEHVTRVVNAVRNEAGRARAYSPLDDPALSGFAKDGDDTQSLRLQLADVCAGYGRAILEATKYSNTGLRELTHRFRLVLYNGRELSADAASRTDARRVRHRDLMHRFYAALA